MCMATTQHLINADELFFMPNRGRCELVRGELTMMSPSGFTHGLIVANITYLLEKFNRTKTLGRITGAETGFIICHNPDSVRAPDVAFVNATRFKENRPEGFFDGAPDLAVEVLSPNDRPNEVQKKIQDWLDSGCCAVWIINSASRSVTIHRNNRETSVLNVGDTLSDEDVLPGFSVAVSEIFE